MTSATPDHVDPAAVATKVRELLNLEVSDPVAFSEALADNIMEPDPVETLAFRAEELAYKSWAAARLLIENANAFHARRRRGSQKQLAANVFINRVGRERRILENIVNGIRARDGVLPNTPNPRRRAEKRLWSLAMKNEPLPPGIWRTLLEEEIAKDRDRKAARRQAQKDARRDARRAQQRS